MKKYKNYFIGLSFIALVLVTICFIQISISKLIPTIEKQVAEEYSVDVHIEHMIMQIGPMLKLKTPIMHIMYKDGQKFAQLETVKFYVPWSSIIKNKPFVSLVQAKTLTVRVNSNDKYLQELINSTYKKDFSSIPNFNVKNYKITYNNKETSDVYKLAGPELILGKVLGYRNFKLKTKGNLSINDVNHITYDISSNPRFDLPQELIFSNDVSFMGAVKDLDFHSDIIADLKFYKNDSGCMQATGFVNIDNVSVLDKSGKEPKSFIYLTFWGDKASILSNIYTSNDKKIYLEGLVNNSKKPELDIKIKTDEINLNDLFMKLKLFADFSRFKNIDDINGKLSANFALKGDLNKIKSTGFLMISDANLRANGIHIDNINSNIDFSNNVINISKAVGYVNNSQITAKGTISKQLNLEVLMDKVELKHLCPEAWGIKNGIVSLIANISGTLDNIVHKENLQITNLSGINNQTAYSVESLKIDTNKNNTAYLNNINITTPYTELIKIPSLRFLIEKDKILLPETKIFMPNSKLTSVGSVVNYNNNNDLSFNINLKGIINLKDIKTVLSNSSKYPVKLVISGNKLVQNVNAQVLMEKTDLLDEPAVINLSSKLSKNGIKLDDLSVSSFNGINLAEDLRANLKGQKKLIISGNIEDWKEPILKNIRVFIPQNLNISFLDTIAKFKGDIFINGNLKFPEIVGQLTVHAIVNQSAQLTVSDLTADFNKNVILLNAPLVKIADSTMGINASVLTNFANEILIKNLNIKSKYLNTNTILMYKDFMNDMKKPVKIQDGKLYAERLLVEIYGAPLYLTAFSSDLSLTNDILSLKNITSEGLNGKFAGTLDFNMKDEKFHSKLMARGVSAAPIFDIISARKESISGTMDFDTDLAGNLSSKKSLAGDIKFIVHNGRMATLGKLEHLLYAQNVVADSMLRTSLSVVTKAITLKDTGLFKYLRGQVKMQDGIANINLLQSQGPLMALYIKGQYNPENDYGKMTVLGRLSDEVVSGLGAFGDFSLNKLMIMLTGEENKYNIAAEDIDKLPQLPMKNTKEFRSTINGIIDKPSSVITFNWISYSQKSLRQKEKPMTNVKVPSFVDELPY